jgi:hypothetical protein
LKMLNVIRTSTGRTFGAVQAHPRGPRAVGLLTMSDRPPPACLMSTPFLGRATSLADSHTHFAQLTGAHDAHDDLSPYPVLARTGSRVGRSRGTRRREPARRCGANARRNRPGGSAARGVGPWRAPQSTHGGSLGEIRGPVQGQHQGARLLLLELTRHHESLSSRPEVPGGHHVVGGQGTTPPTTLRGGEGSWLGPVPRDTAMISVPC